MRPGNCSGSYSAPPRTRAIAWRSSSSPREVDATTFSILKVDEETPSAPEALYKRAGSDRTQVVPYILRSVGRRASGGCLLLHRRAILRSATRLLTLRRDASVQLGRSFPVAARDRDHVAFIVATIRFFSRAISVRVSSSRKRIAEPADS